MFRLLKLFVFLSFSQCYSNVINAKTNKQSKANSNSSIIKTYPNPGYDLHEWVLKNVSYTESALRRLVQGNTVIKVIVDTNGAIKEPVIDGIKIDNSLEKNAIAIIQKKMPKFKSPAYDVNGKAVISYYRIPIRFQLPVSIIKEKIQQKSIGGVGIYNMGDANPNVPTWTVYKIANPGYDIQNWVLQNIISTDSAEGKIVVRIAIDTTGNIEDAVVIGKKVGYGLDEYIINYIINALPKFKSPAINTDGQAIASYFRIPIYFKQKSSTDSLIQPIPVPKITKKMTGLGVGNYVR